MVIKRHLWSNWKCKPWTEIKYLQWRYLKKGSYADSKKDIPKNIFQPKTKLLIINDSIITLYQKLFLWISKLPKLSKSGAVSGVEKLFAKLLAKSSEISEENSSLESTSSSKFSIESRESKFPKAERGSDPPSWISSISEGISKASKGFVFSKIAF